MDTEADALDFDRRREIRQNAFGAGVKFKRGRHQDEARRLFSQCDAGKVAAFAECFARARCKLTRIQ
jgi:hypothetical protein